MNSMKTDVIIVGGGIVGLATAFLAQEKGLSVRVIDRSEKPVGSSIQNFGHACFTGLQMMFRKWPWRRARDGNVLLAPQACGPMNRAPSFLLSVTQRCRF